MGLFRRKRVKFSQLGMLTLAYCPCGCRDMLTEYLDGDIPGYSSRELLRCWGCGSVYTSYPEGKFVAKAYAGPDGGTH